MPKLNWRIKKASDGSFVRRVVEGDLLGLAYIDVEWTHTVGFPHDTIEVPLTHPPDIQFETKKAGKRSVIMDQVIVNFTVVDSTVAMMLDEKRIRLAKALGVEP